MASLHSFFFCMDKRACLIPQAHDCFFFASCMHGNVLLSVCLVSVPTNPGPTVACDVVTWHITFVPGHLRVEIAGVVPTVMCSPLSYIVLYQYTQNMRTHASGQAHCSSSSCAFYAFKHHAYEEAILTYSICMQHYLLLLHSVNQPLQLPTCMADSITFCFALF